MNPAPHADRDHSEARHTPIGCPCDCGNVACVACSKPWPCPTSEAPKAETAERLDRYADAIGDSLTQPLGATREGLARAVLAIVDAEQAELRTEARSLAATLENEVERLNGLLQEGKRFRESLHLEVVYLRGRLGEESA